MTFSGSYHSGRGTIGNNIIWDIIHNNRAGSD